MAVLSENSYGKSAIRLTKVTRGPARHELMEMLVNIELHGAFASAYTAGDNAGIVATDSMKNTVYVLARENTFDSIEAFALILARHFLQTYAQVESASVTIEQTSWQRIQMQGSGHAHAFVGGPADKRTCRALASRKSMKLCGGVSGLAVLKTTGSEFWGFVTDRYRTLKDTKDRIFATAVDATWTYSRDEADFNRTFEAGRAALLETFAAHHSLSVQQTLLEMGKAVLDACQPIDAVEISMPNQHRIPFNLEPFGLKNENDIFVATSEPFGLIKGTVKRK